MADPVDVTPATGDPLVGQETGRESSLSSWAGPYVTEMLGKGQGLANEGYNAYMGPLTAGASDLQEAAFQGIGGLSLPTQDMGVSGYQPGSFTDTGVAQQYMNPYLQASLNPQLEEARRQAGITATQNANKFAGAYGGSAQALFNAESNRNLGQNLGAITGQGYADAYDRAQQQFNTETDRGMTAQDKINLYGTTGLQGLADMGSIQRGIESEGISADRAQFEEERDFPYKQVQYMQSLLQGLPIAAQSYSYSQPSTLSEILSGAGGVSELYDRLFGDEKPTTTTSSAPTTSIRPVARPET